MAEGAGGGLANARIGQAAKSGGAARGPGRKGRRVVRNNVVERMNDKKAEWMYDPTPTRAWAEGTPDDLGIDIHPATYASYDQEDDRALLKSHLAENKVFGDVFLEDRDYEFLRRKRAELEEEQFERWFASTLDFNNPHDVEFAKTLVPEFITRREEEIREKLTLMEKIALINLRGPTNKEDLMLIYAVQQGTINLKILDNIWDPQTADRIPPSAELVPGLLNARKWKIDPASTMVGGMGQFHNGVARQGPKADHQSRIARFNEHRFGGAEAGTPMETLINQWSKGTMKKRADGTQTLTQMQANARLGGTRSGFHRGTGDPEAQFNALNPAA